MRDTKRIKRICKLLEKVWNKHPDQRFAQFLINHNFAKDDFKMWNLEDDIVEKELEQIYKELKQMYNELKNDATI